MIKKLNYHFLYIFISAMLWGTAGVFVRFLENDVKEMQLVLCRAVFSSLIFAVIMIFKDRSAFKVKLKDIWLFALAGVFSIILFNYSYYTTMSLTSLSVAAVLLYTAPFFVVAMSALLFKEKLTLNKSAACIIAFIGCCLVTGLLDSSHTIGPKAIFFGLLTGFGYALYTIFSELLIRRGYKTLTITFYVFLFAAAGTVFFVNIPETFKAVTASPSIFGMTFLMALINTVLPYIFYTAGLKGVSPSTAPIIATVEPVVATVVSVIYNEKISVLGFIGIILVLTSVVILNIRRVRVIANAKINLTLGILGKREDGYHLIDTVMQSVSLYDTLTVRSAKNLIVKCKGINIEQKQNIAYKAAELFFKEVGIEKGAVIKIKKRIPAAAGMGGGSADAAAVLISLNKIYDTNLSEERLEKMSLSLGADVPFFIKGATQRATGIGEKLTPVSCFNKGWFVLAKEDKKPSTAEMYKKVDNEKPPLPNTDLFVANLSQGNFSDAANLFGNSFSCVWKSNLEEKFKTLEADAVSLSGSGPTWFGYYGKKSKAVKAYKKLKSEGTETYIVKPRNFAIR